MRWQGFRFRAGGRCQHERAAAARPLSHGFRFQVTRMNQHVTGLFVSAIAAAVLPLAAAAQDAPADAPRTRVSTKVFINASDLQRDGTTTDDEGLALELKRFFINVDHRFNADWSAHVTTDVTWTRNADPSDLWLRHAYLQRRLGEHAVLRLGNAPTPWIAAESSHEGYRYVDGGLISRTGTGTAADYGVHVQGTRGTLNYAAAVVTGAGYKRPRVGDGADLELRVGWAPLASVELAVGGYRGTLAQDAGYAPHLHTAERWNAMATWTGDRARLGAQYFRADNWDRVTTPAEDASRGWSAWTAWQLTPAYAAFARHDRTEESLRLDPTLEERFSQVGVEWEASKQLKLALVGKRTEVESATRDATTNELGVWGQLAF